MPTSRLRLTGTLVSDLHSYHWGLFCDFHVPSTMDGCFLTNPEGFSQTAPPRSVPSTCSQVPAGPRRLRHGTTLGLARRSSGRGKQCVADSTLTGTAMKL